MLNKLNNFKPTSKIIFGGRNTSCIQSYVWHKVKNTDKYIEYISVNRMHIFSNKNVIKQL